MGKGFGRLLVRGVGQDGTAAEVHECGDSRAVEVSLMNRQRPGFDWVLG